MMSTHLLLDTSQFPLVPLNVEKVWIPIRQQRYFLRGISSVCTHVVNSNLYCVELDDDYCQKRNGYTYHTQ